MQLSIVMIQGEHLAQVDEILEVLGQRKTGREVRDIPGCLVWREAAELVRSAPRPCEVFRVASDQGWTILADESGCLTSEPGVWGQVARSQRTQVVTLCADEDLWSFTMHGPDGLRRAVIVDDEVIEHGAPLPIESLFSGRAQVDDLLALVQSLGVDFDHLNEIASYRLVEVECAA